MRKTLLWVATTALAFAALYVTPLLAVWRPGHG